MFLKAILIKISYCFLLVAIIMFVVKLIVYGRYRSANKENISLNIAWYKQMQIYGTGSASKRKFMQQMNFITSVIFVSAIIFVVVLIVRKLIT